MQSDAPAWLWFLIPVLFLVVGSLIWLGVTSLLGAMSGWFRLQGMFPDRGEPALLSLRMQTGMLGLVSLRNCLRLEACPSGLRVAVPRLLGPFQRPFLVPWASISIRERKVFLGEAQQLCFGTPEAGSLVLSKTAVARIAAAGPLRLPAGAAQR